MKNFTLKFLTVFVIATMLLSTVAMAAVAVVPEAQGSVNVINYNNQVFNNLGYIGNNDSPSDADKAKWATLDLDLEEFTILGLSSGVESASSVFSTSATGTDKNAKIITGYIIPEVTPAPVSNFYFKHDDGIKVLISNQAGETLISQENWKLTGETTMTISLPLETNKVYPIRVEYFDWGGTEVLKTDLPFGWFHASVPEYAVTYEDGIDTVADVVEQVKHGLTAPNLTPAANPGFVFKGWKILEEDTLVDYNFNTPVIAPLTLTAVWEKDINLWVAVDDVADGIYVNGTPVTDIPFSTTESHWKHVASTYVNLLGDTTPFVAAKAVDLHNVIAGFNLVLRSDKVNSTDADAFVQTTTDWWYYVGTTPPANNVKGDVVTEWYKEDYQATEGWRQVSAVPAGPVNVKWASETEFPAGATNNVWIWSSSFFDDKSTEIVEIDTPVYLRSAKHAVPTYTVTFDLEGGTLETTLAPLTGIPHGSKIANPNVVPQQTGFIFAGWDFDFDNTTITQNTSIEALYTPVEEEEEEEDPIVIPRVVTPTVVNYNLTVIATEGGSVPGFDGTKPFSSGTNVNLTVKPNPGYEFTGWTGDVTNNVVVMNESKTVTANFALIVIDEDVAEAADATEEALSTEVTSDEEATPATILDETTPEEVVEALPETSGVAAPLFYAFGTALAGLGLTLKKRKN